jgi:hypothetical protein
MGRLLVCLLVGLVAACGPKQVAVDPAIAGRATLSQADANLHAGCFDCLVDALRQYEATRGIPALAPEATSGAVRAAALLALRERELGTTDSGYLEKARELASQDVAPLLDVIDIMPWRVGTGASGLSVFANREQRAGTLRPLAERDELSAYVWVAYACGSGVGLTMSRAELKASVGSWADTPLLGFRLAICSTSAPSAIDAVVAAEPRLQGGSVFQRPDGDSGPQTRRRRSAVSRGVCVEENVAGGDALAGESRDDRGGLSDGARLLRRDAGARADVSGRAAREAPGAHVSVQS